VVDGKAGAIRICATLAIGCTIDSNFVRHGIDKKQRTLLTGNIGDLHRYCVRNIGAWIVYKWPCWHVVVVGNVIQEDAGRCVRVGAVTGQGDAKRCPSVKDGFFKDDSEWPRFNGLEFVLGGDAEIVGIAATGTRFDARVAASGSGTLPSHVSGRWSREKQEKRSAMRESKRPHTSW